MERSLMERDLAITLISESLSSEIEQSFQSSTSAYSELLSREENSALSRYFSQQDLTESMPRMLADFKIDIEPVMIDAIKLVKKITEQFDSAWRKKFTFEQLYELDRYAAHSALLGALGHGVCASDRPHISAYFAAFGIEEPRCNFESLETFEIAAEVVCRLMLETRSTKVLSTGPYTTLAIDADGDLVIVVRPDVLVEIESLLAKPEAEAIGELLEYHISNGWESLNPDDINALVGETAVILSDEVERDDRGDLVKVGRIFWHTNYQFESFVKKLLIDGSVWLFAPEEVKAA
jgi:hypothetical protein